MYTNELWHVKSFLLNKLEWGLLLSCLIKIRFSLYVGRSEIDNSEPSPRTANWNFLSNLSSQSCWKQIKLTLIDIVWWLWPGDNIFTTSIPEKYRSIRSTHSSTVQMQIQNNNLAWKETQKSLKVVHFGRSKIPKSESFLLVNGYHREIASSNISNASSNNLSWFTSAVHYALPASGWRVLLPSIMLLTCCRYRTSFPSFSSIYTPCPV